MPLPKTSTLALLGSLLLALGACTSQPQSTATTTPTVTSGPTTTTTPTPTPTPTREDLGPEGTAIARDGKVWLVCKDGNYTIDIPENYSPVTFEENDLQKTILQSSLVADSKVHITPRLGLYSVPSREKIIRDINSTLTLEWKIRDDINKFADKPAIVVQFKNVDISDEPDPNYDGTIFSIFTDIGDTRWAFGFSAPTYSEAEALMNNAAATLRKQ